MPAMFAGVSLDDASTDIFQYDSKLHTTRTTYLSDLVAAGAGYSIETDSAPVLRFLFNYESRMSCPLLFTYDVNIITN